MPSIFYMFICYLYFFFSEVTVQIVCPFLSWVISFHIVEFLSVIGIFWVIIHYQLCLLQIVSFCLTAPTIGLSSKLLFQIICSTVTWFQIPETIWAKNRTHRKGQNIGWDWIGNGKPFATSLWLSYPFSPVFLTFHTLYKTAWLILHLCHLTDVQIIP